MRSVDEMVCFDLYAASRAMTALYRPMLEPLGLTYPQYLVLVALPERGAEQASVKWLASRLALDHGTLTPLLRRLQGAGLVTRRRSPADERVVEIALTEAGAALREQFHDVQCEVVQTLGMAEGELEELQERLREVAARARARAGADTSRQVSER